MREAGVHPQRLDWRADPLCDGVGQFLGNLELHDGLRGNVDHRPGRGIAGLARFTFCGRELADTADDDVATVLQGLSCDLGHRSQDRADL